MVSLTALWLPIVLSAVLVFVASSILHMVATYHRSDYQKVPREDDVMEALRKFNVPPGDYMMPCAGSPAVMKTPAFLDKMNKGPVGVFTIMKTGQWAMGSQLTQWFVFCVVVSLFAAYIASRALPPGADYLRVSQMASCTAFAGYALGHWPQSIWYKRSLTTTIKHTIDGLVYAFITGGALGWLWPR